MVVGQEKESPKGPEKESSQETEMEITPPPTPPAPETLTDATVDKKISPDESKADIGVDENKANVSGNPEISITEASDTDESQEDACANPGESQEDACANPGENQEVVCANPDESEASPEKKSDAEQENSNRLDEGNNSAGRTWLPLRFLNYVTEKCVQIIVIAVTLFLSYAIYRFRLELEDE